jgi:quercetin dioxygenase-like cupin family protein
MFTLDSKSRSIWLAALLILPLPLAAQAPSVITMDFEPHHHLALHNDYVNVYKVEAAPGDSIVLHRHDQDTVAIAIGDQTVTIGIPGKPDVHAKNLDGQVRLQLLGYIHSTHVDGQATYHTIAVELLQPQTGEHNLCAPALAGKPLTCPDAAANTSPSKRIDLPQFASNQTHVQTVRVLPHQDAKIANATQFELLVALDPASISPASGSGPDELLRPGEYLWFDKGAPARVLKNGSNKEVRFVEVTFKPFAPAKTAADSAKPQG